MHLVPVGRLLLCQGLWSNNNPANLFCKFSGLIGALLINVVRMGCAEKHLLMHHMKSSVWQMYETGLLSCSFTRKSQNLGINQWYNLLNMKFDFASVRPQWSFLSLWQNKFLFKVSDFLYIFFLNLCLLLWVIWRIFIHKLGSFLPELSENILWILLTFLEVFWS